MGGGEQRGGEAGGAIERGRVLTSASFEPVLVSEGREGIGDHLHELQRRAIVVVTSLERLYEPLKRPAVFLGSRMASITFSRPESKRTPRHSRRKGSRRPHA